MSQHRRGHAPSIKSTTRLENDAHSFSKERVPLFKTHTLFQRARCRFFGTHRVFGHFDHLFQNLTLTNLRITKTRIERFGNAHLTHTPFQRRWCRFFRSRGVYPINYFHFISSLSPDLRFTKIHEEFHYKSGKNKITRIQLPSPQNARVGTSPETQLRVCVRWAVRPYK